MSAGAAAEVGAAAGVRLTVDGVALEVAPGTTVLEAARSAGLWVPTLWGKREPE